MVLRPTALFMEVVCEDSIGGRTRRFPTGQPRRNCPSSQGAEMVLRRQHVDSAVRPLATAGLGVSLGLQRVGSAQYGVVSPTTIARFSTDSHRSLAWRVFLRLGISKPHIFASMGLLLAHDMKISVYIHGRPNKVRGSALQKTHF